MRAKLWFVIELPDSQSEKGKTFRSRMRLGKESVTPRHYCHLRLEEVHSITSSSCVPSAGRLMESQAADGQGYNLQWWQKVHLLYYAGQAGSYAWQSSHLAHRLDNNFVKLSNQIKSLPKEMTNLSQRKREKPVEKNSEPPSSTLTNRWQKHQDSHQKKKKKWITLFWFRKRSKTRVSTIKAIEKSHHIKMKSLPLELSTQTAKKKKKKI